MRARDVLTTERASLVELLRGLTATEWGAATLCAGWTVADVAAHLIVRERETITAGTGILLRGPLRRYTRARMDAWVIRGPDAMVAVLARPPGFVQRALAPITAGELYVHQEDIRRGELDRPRTDPLPDELDELLWRAVLGHARVQLLRLRVDGVLALGTPDGRSTAYDLGLVPRSRPPAAADVEVIGPPGELLLFITGRKDAAKVEVAGERDLVLALRGAPFGL